ncbi:uncharacterized protein ALTATR162_LOCUS57 [Alternaria atra]|uniref:Integral membrane protein n=1 Tax=Alternaria atra TaxID=119953 RepID=A0A8J2MU95_9PLEO|nr:uncharacterized protein ALTATR162_LOCUS57 [Alternaria atra]CAG5137232.1 unnamed protein product [Alternaria atra]
MLVRMFGLVSNVAMSFAVVLGWWAMVTGHAVVLYSRLHLVSDRKKTRRVLIMIVTNFIVLHLPVSALYLAINVRSFNSLTNVFKIYEKIQLAGFSVQECIIAGIYIWEASRTLNHVLKFREPQGKNDSAPGSCNQNLPGIQQENVTAVRLDAKLVPKVRDINAESKLVDFVLIAISQVLADTRNRITSITSISHTTYEGVRLWPICISIETKTLDGKVSTALVQLSLWATTRFNRLRTLLPPSQHLDCEGENL